MEAVLFSEGAPPDPQSVIDRILESAAELQRFHPAAVPMAFWDFDGTLLEGDCVDGFRRSDGAGYAGLVERAIVAGLCPAYQAEAGVVCCEQNFRDRMQRHGRAAAYAFQSLIFAGVREALLREMARQAFAAELGGWLFAEARDCWRRLEAGGVRCWVLSASPDFFVKGVAAWLDVPDVQCTGMRLRMTDDDRLGGELIEPVLFGDGKAQRMRALLAECAAANLTSRANRVESLYLLDLR